MISVKDEEIKAVKAIDSSDHKELMRGFQKKLNSFDCEKNALEKSIRKKEKRYLSEIQVLKESVDNSIKECKFLQQRAESVSKEQIIYYNSIISRGIDVRAEGLVWVIKRIMELTISLEYTIFPRFLDQSQIDYLLKV
jgi:hypothetical protein